MCPPFSRRAFLKATGGALFLAGAGPAIRCAGGNGDGPRSRVAVARDPAVFREDGGLDAAVARRLVDRAVCLVTDRREPAAAWKSLFGPGDVVGIKLNCLAGKMLSTRPELCHAVVEGLGIAGVRPGNIVLWDQIGAKLREAGYETTAVRAPGVKCVSNDVVGYDDEPQVFRSIGSCFTTILSRACNAIVNMPVLKDHELAGVTLSMKNFYGAIQNPNKYHDDNCNPFIADLNTHDFIRKKQRLIVMDATTGLYHGGPSYKHAYAWKCGAVIAGTDPVAVDAFATNLIEDKRRENSRAPLAHEGRAPRYIQTAAELGLGQADLSRIDVREE